MKQEKKDEIVVYQPDAVMRPEVRVLLGKEGTCSIFEHMGQTIG